MPDHLCSKGQSIPHLRGTCLLEHYQFLKYRCLLAHNTHTKKTIFPDKSPKQEPHYKILLYEFTWYIMEDSGNSRIFKKQFSFYCAVALEADPGELLRTSMAPLTVSVGTMKLQNNSSFPNVRPLSPCVSQGGYNYYLRGLLRGGVWELPRSTSCGLYQLEICLDSSVTDAWNTSFQLLQNVFHSIFLNLSVSFLPHSH